MEEAAIAAIINLRQDKRAAKRGGDRMASASTQRSRAPAAASSSRSKRKSIFGRSSDPQGESKREYKARAKRERAASLGKQRRMHTRAGEKKQGKVLDALAGVNDDDPMAGL